MSIYLNDCLTQLNNIADNSIDLIYLDPPFFSQKKQTSKTRDNTKEYSFNDKWNSINEYLDYIKLRLNECRRVLKNTGSIFLHCDKSASHYLRVLLDEVFYNNNFQSEIIWSYKRWSNAKKGLLNGHQTIYFYSKTKDFKFNNIYTDYSATTNIDQILQLRERDENGKSVYKKNEKGEVIMCQEKKGVPLSDVWEIPYLNPKAAERTGYPTQKPILLLEQIIKLATDEGDIVLDPFCGSGTTLVAAKLLNRRYIGIDSSEDAIKLTKIRVQQPFKTTSKLLEKGIDKYKNKTEEETAILKAFDAIPVQRNKGIDGFLNGNYCDGSVSIKIQKDAENIDESLKLLINASNKKKCSFMILIRTKVDEQERLISFPKNVLLIDRYDITLKEWISSNINNKSFENLCS